jgi:DNA-binding transcriptional LysR family regulator
MEFHQLRSFVATAEELSITAAARRVHLSQPALSRQIQSLEEELGVALFDRVRQRIHLTAAGRYFLDRARQILCDAETSAQQVREQFGDGKRTIRLGFLTIFLDDLVAPAVKALRKSHPRSAVALYELSPQAQLDRLRNDELDLALLGNLGEEDRARFTVRTLMRNPMAAVLPDDHRLAGRRQIDLKELAGDSFVSLSDAVFPGRRQFLRGICRMRGFDPAIAEECDSLPLLLAAVSGGSGVALLPAHSAKLPHSGSVFVRLKAPVVHAEVMAVHKAGADRGALAALIEPLGGIAARMG